MKHKPSHASLILSVTLLGMSGAVLSDDDNALFSRIFGSGEAPGVAPVKNQLYLDECGSCHFPYQPGLLPARSWTKMMTGLDNHFDENAELPAEDTKILTDYLVKNAADHADYKRSRKIMNSLRADDEPLRVTETPYMIEKHEELTPQMVKENPEVVSLSRCDACHTKANTGSFSESEIMIPGYGTWDD